MKKWFLRIGLGFLAVVILLYAFVFVRSILPTTVMNSGLKPARASIPEDANGFYALEKARAKLWWPKEQNQPLGDLARNTNWNNALAGTVLANNREALEAWDAAARLPDFQVPEISKADDLLPYLSDWKPLAQLAEVRQNQLMRSGQEKAAFDQMLNQVLLARRMQNSHSALIGYLVGTAVNGLALSQFQRWVGRSHLTPRDLKDYIRQLDQDPADAGAAFAETMKVEYQVCVGTIEAMRQGKMIDPETGKPYPHPSRLLPVLNPSKTRALFATEFNALVKAAPLHFNEAKLPQLFTQRPNILSLILSGNLMGQVWFQMMVPAVDTALAKKSQGDAQLQATRIILALRAYELTHGKLPADLNALVPEFLFEVPADDFDGQPLHYSPEKKMVYSVGKDLKDDGGMDRDPEAKTSQTKFDLVYRFEF
jgi:hypothetical protein